MVRKELVIHVGQPWLVRGTNQRLQHTDVGLPYYLHGKHFVYKKISF